MQLELVQDPQLKRRQISVPVEVCVERGSVAGVEEEAAGLFTASLGRLGLERLELGPAREVEVAWAPSLAWAGLRKG